MFGSIKHEIKLISRNKIAKMASRNKKFKEYRERIEKRSGLVSAPLTAPVRSNDHFDPYHCAKNANIIAKVLWRKIEDGTYKPEAAKKFDIPKKGGGFRELTSFAIPDSAVAKLVYRSIVRRNIRVFSANSYAYLPDRDIFDAIKALSGIDPKAKTFSVQVDFKKFFDRIPHDFLNELIDGSEKGKSVLRITQMERRIIRAFMTHESLKKITKRSGAGTALVEETRSIGTPQGSSVSLILANLALHDLDKKLEMLSGKFVRYADDIVALTGTYEQALCVEQAFYDHAHLNKLEVNKKKSPGISAFAEHEQEIRTVKEIDFLGYRFTRLGTTISDVVEAKIKLKISRLIHLYLIQYIKGGNFNPYRVSVVTPNFDWDLLGLISELRRTMYGGNSEKNISESLYKESKIRRMHGIMAHYALIEDMAPFKRLDGWMVNEIRRAMRQRELLIRQSLSCSTQSGLLPSNAELLSGSWLDMNAWVKEKNSDGNIILPEVRMPSFIRACKAAKIHIKNYGLDRRDKSLNGSSNDLSDLLEY